MLTQTTPPYTPVCPRDKLVVTCVTSGTTTYWRYSTSPATRLSMQMGNNIQTGNGTFLLNFANINGNTITSTGTNQSVTVSMNGTIIACSPTLLNNYDTFIINIRGKRS